MILTGRVRSRNDPRTLQMSSISSLPTPPSSYFAATVPDWPTLGNDKVPCCTCAAAAHMIHNWTAARDRPVLISEQQVLATYVQVSGGGPDGAEMLDVLRFWHRSGIADRRLKAYVALDPLDSRYLRTAVYLFGAAYIGLNFPDFAVKEVSSPDRVWALPPGGATGDNAPREANGHAVAVVGYDDDQLYVVSCGARWTMTWDFYRAYNEEAYAVLSRDWYGQDRRSPNGFDLAELRSEIIGLQAAIPAPEIPAN